MHLAWVRRGTVRVKCLAQEHNATIPARAGEPGLLDPEHREYVTLLSVSPPNQQDRRLLILTFSTKFNHGNGVWARQVQKPSDGLGRR